MAAAASPNVTDRLHLLHEVNRGLTASPDLRALVQYVTDQTRQLFNADGCGVLILDAERREFYFPFVSEADRAFETRLQTLRFPAESGIAGWVFAHDEAVMVTNTSEDARFYGGVDEVTKMDTHAVLCAPLRTATGNIGVIEVVNPAAECLTTADLEFLETLAGDIAVAYEKALLVHNLRGEVDSLRQALRLAGFGMIGFGTLFILGALVAHLARALPIGELIGRPALWMGLVGVVLGMLLAGLGKGRLGPLRATRSVSLGRSKGAG